MIQNTPFYAYRNIGYFKGLSPLRFLAAYLVVLHHVETIRIKEELYNIPTLSIFHNGGPAVFFFFVLSGFLITYLLLKEHQETGTTAVNKFYMRRILRIWPLYYLLVLIGVLVIPAILRAINYPYDMPYTATEALPLYAVFLPFVVNIIYGNSLLNPLWSIGVEEIFYLIWAPVFRFLKQYILPICFAIILGKMALNLILYHYDANSFAFKLSSTIAIECMAIGGVGALWLFNRSKDVSLSLFFTRPAQLLLGGTIIAELIAHLYLSDKIAIWNFIFNQPVLSDFLRSVLYCWLIINISVNTKSLFSVNNRLFNYLGDISYGIYMYQMCVIFGCVFVFKKIGLGSNNLLNLVLFNLLVLLGVIIVSALSKKFFEDRFLRLKKYFQPK